MAFRNPFISANEIWQQLPSSSTAGVHTVRRRLISAGLRSYKAARKPLLTIAQIKKRMIFCKQHKNWTSDQWAKVLWSDESKFVQFGAIHHHVRRPAGCRFQGQFTVPTTKSCASVMVWGCFVASGRGGLHFLPKGTTMNGANYCELLKDKLEIWMGCRQCDHFQQDNGSCHMAKVVTKWLTLQNIAVIQFPPNSPDLNPIENLWYLIKTKVAGKKVSSIIALKEAITQVWCTEIMPDLCRTLSESMPRRIEMVLKAKGHHSKY